MSLDTAAERWLSYLRKNKNYTQEQADEVVGKWQAQRQNLTDKVAGISCWVDLKSLILHIDSFPGSEEIARILLSNDRPNPESTSGRRQWGCLDTKGKYLKPISLEENSQPELVITPDFSFITASSIHNHPLLIESRFLLDAVQQDKRPHLVDLYLSPDSQWLFATHRQAGEVIVISLEDYEITERWQVRKPGSNRTLNVCFDSKGEKAYITDNESIQLWIIEMETFKHKIWKSGLGILGNLMPAPDPRYLYICIQRPQFSLLYFDTETLSTPYSVEIKGDSWCMQRILPCDPMQLSPDGKLLYFNTWTESAGLRTPLIQVIKTSDVRTMRSFPIQDGSQPAMLGHTRPNPLHEREKLDFQTFLVQAQILTETDLQAPEVNEEVELKQERKAPVKARKFQIYQPPKDDPNLWDQIGQEAEELDLPAEAEMAIVDLLNWSFYRITLTNLLLHSDEVKRLKKLAHELRKELRTKRVVLAELDEVMGNHSLRTPIAREVVLEVMKQARLRGDAIRFEDVCPLCETPLEQDDGLACPACFYRLDLPEERELRDKLSVDSSTRLFPGQMLVVLPGQNRFYTMNVWRQLLGVFEGKAAEVGDLAYAVVLPNHNFLVADKKNNKLAEYSPGGEQIWKAKLALRQPVMATYHLHSDGGASQEERMIVVDQGNQRVLELDRSGRHWRRYPILKTPEADKLKTPCDVQLTPTETWLISDTGRKEVLEINHRGELIKTFGAEQGVQCPIMARRLPDGRTWIVDSEVQACLEISPEGKRLRAARYWPPEAVHGAHWRDEAAPTWVTRLHNGELVFAGEKVMMQFSPEKELTRWVQGFPDSTVSEESLLKAQFRSRSSAEMKQKKASQIKEELKSIHLLAEANEEHLEGLAGLVLHLKAKPGDWLVPPGEMGNALYFLLEGELEMVSAQEENVVIFSVKAGDICGQQALISDDSKVEKPGIRALTDVRVIYLERGEFKKAVVKFPKLFHIVRQVDAEHQRLFKNFRERKTVALQEELRSRLASHRIREFPLFASADEAFFQDLSHRVHALAYMPEQTVFARNESGGSIFMLLEGQVSIQRKGDKQPTFQLEAGQIFGEMSVMLDQPRSATVRTEDYCKLYELDLRHIRELSEKYPWFEKTLREMAEARQETNTSDIAAFEARVGINRSDLPRIDIWALVELRGDEMVYMPSLLQDVIVGYTWQGEILWFWGKESGKELFQPYRLAVLKDSLLVTDTGNGRVLEIDLETRAIRRRWQGLQNPRSATLTEQGFLLVAEESKSRLVSLSSDSKVNWEYGAPNEIMNPHYAEVTPEGTILFADAGLHLVREISLSGETLWSWGQAGQSGTNPDELDSPAFVYRLDDGSTLIADTGNHRLVWLHPEEEPQIIKGNLSDPLVAPHHCEIMSNGDWLIYSASSEKVVRLSQRSENIWSAHLSGSGGTSPVILAPTSTEDRWILDLDRLTELDNSPAQVTELKVEQELESETQPQLSETQQANLEERAQRWNDLELEVGTEDDSDSRWKGLDFLDAIEEEPEAANLGAFEEPSADSEELTAAFAFLDEEPTLEKEGPLLNLGEDALSFLDENQTLSNQTVMHIPTAKDDFNFLDEDLPLTNQTIIHMPPSTSEVAKSENPFSFLDAAGEAPTDTIMHLPDPQPETAKPQNPYAFLDAADEVPTDTIMHLPIKLAEEPLLEAEKTVYPKYDSIFDDSTSPAETVVISKEQNDTALGISEPPSMPSLEPNLGKNLVAYFAPEEGAEDLEGEVLELPPVEIEEEAPTKPVPIVLAEPELAEEGNPWSDLSFLEEADEPPLTREEMEAREGDARLAAIQNVALADPDAEEEDEGPAPIFLTDALDHEIVKLDEQEESN
jgi:CRP-like cAMP-binding protein